MYTMQSVQMERSLLWKFTKLLFWFSKTVNDMLPVISVFVTVLISQIPVKWLPCGQKRSAVTWEGMVIISSKWECRLHTAGLPVPEAVSLTRNVLVMDFLGDNGWPAPRLKDVALTKKSYNRIYHRLILLLRSMYQDCRLVHGDLSEYNLLYVNESLNCWIVIYWIIRETYVKIKYLVEPKSQSNYS